MQENRSKTAGSRQTHITQSGGVQSCLRILPSWKAFPAFLIILTLGVALSACDHPGDKPAAPAAPPPKVKIISAINRDVTEWDEYTGRIAAVNSVDIRARVGGYLEKVNFKAGDKVKKGDVLFLIDAKPYQAQLNYAAAELARAKTRQELAKNDLQRATNLYKEKAISTEEFDGRSKGLREAAAAVESAEANLYTARINLDYCEIRAPISGRISRELITAGNLVNANDSSMLTTIVSTDPVYVYVDADEQAVLKYRRQARNNQHGSSDLKGLPLQLAVVDESGYPHVGYLDYASPREDAATATISLRGVFANADELLTPGMFARVRIQGGGAYNALLVPDRAIGTDQAQRFVWVTTQDNQVEYRQVILGTLIGQLRVIKDGLRSGESVVVDGLQKLRPGIKVDAERIPDAEFQGGL